MPTPIQTKLNQLRQSGFDPGAQVTNETDCGYGGRLQQFANVTIYYHAVMGSVAHEVHGGIRTKYLSMGGHDINPATRNRFFGFPLSDEKNSGDDRCRVSQFEWGAIYWINGGVAVYGKLYTAYQTSGGETGRLGYPIADPVAVAGGQASFFEHGLLYFGDKSNGQVIEITYQMPQLGQPWMITPAGMPDKEVVRFTFFNSLMNTNIAGHLFEELFNGRIFLKETAGQTEVPLIFDFTSVNETPATPSMKTFSCAITLKGAVKNYQLYDIILKFPSRIHAIAPHAVYVKDSWHDFNFIHATDIHVSRRLDGFRKFFRDKNMDDAVRNFNNFNDNFREFIQYANRLHRQGKLDFIMMTGDLVDYCFEDGGKGYHLNNYVYFENIIRGLTGKPDQVQNDELIVPVFTSLGNHDYRVKAYYPMFTVDAPAPVSNRDMEQFASMNLTKDEATLLTKELLGIRSMVSTDRAYEMVKPDRNNLGRNLDHYFKNICRNNSYSIMLGEHEVIMIDGKWDDEPIDSNWETFKYALGVKGEATDNFADSSPDSVGFADDELNIVRNALQKDGLVIIGFHDPVINPRSSDYSWFLRESVRTANPAPYTNEMRKYLLRKDLNAFVTLNTGKRVVVDPTVNAHPGWSRTTSFWFHEGNGTDLLDYGVMRGKQERFLKMISGAENSRRPADLVLSGHVHKNWESRLIWDAASGKMRFCHDFYTENPAAYYHSYDLDMKGDEKIEAGDPYNNAIANVFKLIRSKQKRIHVEITSAAGNNEQPEQRGSGVWWIRTKPYPYTLNEQQTLARSQQWWLNLRPLLVQTAALGPSEWLRSPEKQPDFRGCRLIAVQNNIISQVRYVTNEGIKKELSNRRPAGTEHVPQGHLGGTAVIRDLQ